MRVVIARCTVDYAGRLSAHLPPAVRLLMVKAGGCVAIHADSGAYKPLNWMCAPNVLHEEPGRWVVSNPKGETLTIAIDEVLSDTSWELGVDPGLQKDGVEAHLQELLAAHPTRILPELVLVRREHPTDIGPVDLLCRDVDGRAIAIEIKRRGEIDGVEQLGRYLETTGTRPPPPWRAGRARRPGGEAAGARARRVTRHEGRDVVSHEMVYSDARAPTASLGAPFRRAKPAPPLPEVPFRAQQLPRPGLSRVR